MKLQSAHLTYCTNIHAGETWAEHFNSLQDKFPQIKAKVAADEKMGIGLRISNTASLDLMNSEKIQEFKIWLAENDAYVFTINGFPYGDFHDTVVKNKVHSPDWTSADRVSYTLRLIEILAGLLPEGMDGGISTSPLGYKFWYAGSERNPAIHKSTINIISILEKIYLQKINFGTLIHLDIEPEPDGLIETGSEFIDWYLNILSPLAERELGESLGLTTQEVEELLRDHLCLCYDVCHFAIGYEDHSQILAELEANKIRVGKVQISAALKCTLPEESDKRNGIRDAFSKFDEPTYLHQVVARTSAKNLIRYRDLPDALADIQNYKVAEWRAHFHVPIFLEDLGLLRSTQTDILTVLNIQKQTPITNHLEVETYTWDVLPESLKSPIEESICRELEWVKDILDKNLAT